MNPHKAKDRILSREERQERDSGLIADALTGKYTLEQLGEHYDITKARTGQILANAGYAIKGLQAERRKEQEDKKAAYQQFINILTQYYFDRLIAEKGENHALAWRCQDFYKCGKNYSLEQLTKLIGARRNGEGYYRSIKYAGLATKKEEVMQKIPYVKYVLTKALHDVI